jgi:hypothetical protein
MIDVKVKQKFLAWVNERQWLIDAMKGGADRMLRDSLECAYYAGHAAGIAEVHAIQTGLPESIKQALNEGDGSYKP